MSSPESDRRVFVDTSAYYAVVDRRDNDHEAAAAGLHRLVEDRKRLVTTNVVLFELHSLLVNRINRQVAGTLLWRSGQARSLCECVSGTRCGQR